MQIKRASKTKRFNEFLKANLKTRSFFFSLLLYTLIVFVAGATLQRMGLYGSTMGTISGMGKIFKRHLKVWVLSHKYQPDMLAFDISYENYQQLTYKRQQAMDRGILLTDPEDYVPAKVTYRDQVYFVKMRLKGDWTDHLEGDSWSFRVIVKNDQTIAGMKKFSLHHPKTRRYLYEWLFHQLLKFEGLIGLRYDFVNVMVNGRPLGIYGLEEHFEKRLIENNREREGPIIRFEEDLLWRNRVHRQNKQDSDYYLYTSAISAHNLNQTLASENQREQYLRAISLLESLRDQTLKPSQVLDIEKFAMYYAIIDLTGAYHAAHWTNQKYYYNPVTDKLEPIGFDADAGNQIRYVMGETPARFHGQDMLEQRWLSFVWKDHDLIIAYVKALEKIITPGYIEKFLSSIETNSKRYQGILDLAYSDYYFNANVLHSNRDVIRKSLQPIKGLHAYTEQKDGSVEIEVANLLYLPIEIIGVQAGDQYQPLVPKAAVLEPRQSTVPLDYHILSLPFSRELLSTLQEPMTLHYRILGSSHLLKQNAFNWPRKESALLQHSQKRNQPNFEEFDFIQTDPKERNLWILQGDWTLNQPLVIPPDWKVIMREGTNLHLNNKAYILSYSPLDWQGSEAGAIRIDSPDGTGQGVVVLNTQQMSQIHRVEFIGLNEPNHHAWKLTGALTFYEAPVTIRHCIFRDISAEDNLNVIRSSLDLQHTYFENAASDAIDVDFGHGKIRNSKFKRIGNDAIDVSGSEVRVDKVEILGAGDKGISVGEQSRLEANHLKIREAVVALASKDLSELRASEIEIFESDIGFSAYQKKPEFGGGSIYASHIKMNSVTTPYRIENTSSMILDGQVVK